MLRNVALNLPSSLRRSVSHRLFQALLMTAMMFGKPLYSAEEADRRLDDIVRLIGFPASPEIIVNEIDATGRSASDSPITQGEAMRSRMGEALKFVFAGLISRGDYTSAFNLRDRFVATTEGHPKRDEALLDLHYDVENQVVYHIKRNIDDWEGLEGSTKVFQAVKLFNAYAAYVVTVPEVVRSVYEDELLRALEGLARRYVRQQQNTDMRPTSDPEDFVLSNFEEGALRELCLGNVRRAKEEERQRLEATRERALVERHAREETVLIT